MGRPCTVCSHPQRREIDDALVAVFAPFRAIGRQFNVGRDSLRRHKAHHLAVAVARGKELVEAAQAGVVARIGARLAEQREIEDARQVNVFVGLGRLFSVLTKMLDACDQFLSDPNDPSRYDLNPRAHELEVTYLVCVARREDGSEIVATRKVLLSELMGYFDDKVPDSRGVLIVKWKMADPRRLVLDSVRHIEGLQRWLGEALAKAKGDGSNLARSEEWRALRGKIVAALQPYPEARLALAVALDDEAEAPAVGAVTGAEQAM
jgi:hypothetical protein